MPISANKVLGFWVISTLVVILMGSSIFFLDLKQDLAVNSSKLEAEMLMKMLTSTLRYDLLGGNLMVAGQRIQSLLDGTTGKSTCVQIRDNSKNIIISGGNESICRFNNANKLLSIIYFDSNNTSPAFEIQLYFITKSIPIDVSIKVWFTALMFILIIVMLLLMLFNFFRRIFNRINSIVSGELQLNSELKFYDVSEEIVIRETVSQINKKNEEINAIKIANREVAVYSSLAKQVAHDIRSPLSALNIVISQFQNLPEDKRIIARSALQRINDIANSLLKSSKESMLKTVDQSELKGNDLSLKNEFIPALVDALVSEKRIQFREKSGIEIEVDLTESYGGFAKINSVELKRVISNLINNSVESFKDGNGNIKIINRVFENCIQITVSDNGCGIPSEIKDNLGKLGVTHGKGGTESGSGLGLYHAKNSIELMSGKLEITSKLNEGTQINIILPRSVAPKWFVEKLTLIPKMSIISLDDDFFIHKLWASRFDSKGFSLYSIKHTVFTSGLDLKTWFNARHLENDETEIYLIDYELLNQTCSGLDIIERLDIGKNAILVTSRFEEAAILARCEKLGVRLIPKTMASYVPIEIQSPKVKLDAILIDDDVELVHSVWNIVAQSKGLNIKTFSSPKEFLSDEFNYDRETPIYVDVSLGEGINGIEFANQIHNLGFEEISLATGYNPESIQAPPFIRRIVGKDFPVDLL